MEITLVKGKIDHTMLGKDCFFLVDNIRQDKAVGKLKYGEQVYATLKQVNNESMSRSLQQLKLYWACCTLVADNYPESNSDFNSWDTKEKVSEQCKIHNRHIACYYYYHNPKTKAEQLNIRTKSISFSKLNHKKALVYFDNALKFLASKLNISTDALADEAREFLEINFG